MKLDKQNKEYIEWFHSLKNKIGKAQIKAAISVNSELIKLYWDLGEELFEKQEKQGWGNSIVENISKDLKNEFPNMTGFSRRNLFYMKSFYTFYKSDFEKVQQLVAQIPWGHNIKIISKSQNIEEAVFYLKETLKNSWSRDILDMQIKSNLYERQGKAVTNFTNSLPKPKSDLASQTLKDPYLFDFLTLKKMLTKKVLKSNLQSILHIFCWNLGKDLHL